MFNSKKIDASTFLPPSPSIKIGCCIFKSTICSNRKTTQEVYLESRGKCCKKLLRFNGYLNKVHLYPEEGVGFFEAWARNASSSYLIIKLCPWWSWWNMCIVEEIVGTRRKRSTYAHMSSSEPGSLTITGSFKKQGFDPDFKLNLTSNITTADYNMGYCLTGSLERGCKKTSKFHQTHFVVIRRRWPSLKNKKKPL